MDKLNRLEEMAKKATQEDWDCLYRFDEWENYVGPKEWADMGKCICICRYAKDADYISAANPAFILALISRLKVINELYGEIFKEATDYLEKLKQLEKEADWLAERLACPNIKSGCQCGLSKEYRRSQAHEAVKERK